MRTKNSEFAGEIVVSEIPNVYDKNRVKRWVICDFVKAANMDENNIELERMPYEQAHLKHMAYLADLRAKGIEVTKETCGRPNCRACQDDHQQSWRYVTKEGVTRFVVLFSR